MHRHIVTSPNGSASSAIARLTDAVTALVQQPANADTNQPRQNQGAIKRDEEDLNGLRRFITKSDAPSSAKPTQRTLSPMATGPCRCSPSDISISDHSPGLLPSLWQPLTPGGIRSSPPVTIPPPSGENAIEAIAI